MEPIYIITYITNDTADNAAYLYIYYAFTQMVICKLLSELATFFSFLLEGVYRGCTQQLIVQE